MIRRIFTSIRLLFARGEQGIIRWRGIQQRLDMVEVGGHRQDRRFGVVVF